jgi:endonuclease/exonuclease/phosphatase family metal-dependent hydrolase
MLKVMDLNLANYDDHGDWSDRLNVIVGVIIDNQPDIISMQEVRFNPDQATTQVLYQNMGEQILYALNQKGEYLGSEIMTQPVMYYLDKKVIAPYYPLPSAESSAGFFVEWEGLSIISKKHVVETGTRFLSIVDKSSDANKRSVKYIAFDAGDGSLFYVFDCHYSFDKGTNFNQNVSETIDYMSAFAGSPCLLMGDMNMPDTNQDAFQPFYDANYYDLWSLLHSEEPVENGYTDESDNLFQRIDYIWANSALPQSKVTSIVRVATDPVDGVYASDHVGLLVEINI